jgi:hypothetical protein
MIDGSRPGQRFFRIRKGRLDGQLKDDAYQATTTDFWNSMEAVGGPQMYVLGGPFNHRISRHLSSAPRREIPAEWLFGHHVDWRTTIPVPRQAPGSSSEP